MRRRLPRLCRFKLGLGRAGVFGALICAVVAGSAPVTADSYMPTVRVGVLKFGTVSWELDVIKTHGLDHKNGFDLYIVPLASKNATAVALQGGAVDMIVTDWFWVSRQRDKGYDYTFAPYSVAAGGLLARPDSGIASLDDLQDRKIGIAGGQVDKSWLLMRAYSADIMGEDIGDVVTPVYGAPPLLNELVERNEFPAVLTFWNYQAPLKAKGYNQIVDIATILESLNVAPGMPIIGWVFRDSWAADNKRIVPGFLEASREAKRIMSTSDEEWQRLAPKIKVTDKSILPALRDGFREGIPREFTPDHIAAAERLFSLLGRIGGAKLVGESTRLAPGVFWAQSLDSPPDEGPPGHDQ